MLRRDADRGVFPSAASDVKPFPDRGRAEQNALDIMSIKFVRGLLLRFAELKKNLQLLRFVFKKQPYQLRVV